ncbi:MAG: SusC/RagA family TonB-linked outer membrane protein [Gemmatimonadaceae bacterium]
MRTVRPILFAASLAPSLALTLPLPLRAAAAQERGGAPQTYAVALRARYVPLETVRDGTVRMPKPLARTVSVQREGALLQQVLLDIATQAGLGLSYGEDLAKSHTIVSLSVANASAADALAAATRNTQWAVLVTPSGQVAVVSALVRQLGSVAGRVSDRASAIGIAGVTLTLEGTRLSAFTNDSGTFRIPNVPPGAYTLSARRIGYTRAVQSVTVVADQATQADFALQATVNVLDQVVVTGVPTATSKRTLGNSIATIDAAELTQRVVNSNVTELLQAKAPGVSVMKSSGTPGTGGTIRIRGSGSLVSSAEPVIYVDGVRIYSGAAGNFRNSWETPTSGMRRSGGGQDAFSVDVTNPEDIESIEVIKGPAAATLYGAEAANGVIQIITKKGTRGQQKLVWTAKVQGGQTDWGLDRRTSYTTCTAARIADKLPNGSPAWPGCSGKTPGTILSQTSLDAPGALREGTLLNYALSLRGGGAEHSFFAAADQDREQGVFPNSEDQRTTARANFAFYPKDAVDFVVNMGYARTKTQFPQGDNAANMLESAWIFQPGASLGRGQVDGFAGGNPEQHSLYDNRLTGHRVTLGTTLNVRPISWFSNRLTVGADISSRQANRYVAPGSLWAPGEGQMTEGAPRNTVYTFDYAGTVQHAVPLTRLSGSLSFGAQYTNTQFRNTVAQGNNFPSASVRDVALAAVRFSWTEFSDVKSLGFYAQEQLAWKDRLYLTGALRVDNSSVFGDDIKQLYFPKLSAAYVISEEPYLQKVSWIEQIKLRAAWGQAGNAPDPFAAVTSYTAAPNVDNTTDQAVPSLRLNTRGNDDVKPERGTEIELGFDAGFLRNRLGVELTYYNKTTKDALMAVPNPPSAGFPGSTFQNLGEINNKGVELAVNTVPYQSRLLTWDARLGLATNNNRLVRFGYKRQPIILGLTAQNQRHVEGYPLGGFWVHFPVKNAAGDYAAGEPRYVGPANPTREVSLANTFTINRNLRLFTLIDYKGGFFVLNHTDWRRCAAGTCWEVNNPSVPDERKRQLLADIGVNNGLYTEMGDFTKLRDVSLTYSLPGALSRRLGSALASVTLAGHNLGFLKKDYRGLDPEVNFAGDNGPTGAFAWTRVDYWTMPMTRRLTLSLDVQF